MNLENKNRIENEIKCYGQTIADLQEERAEAKAHRMSTEMYVMCILSDAQEALAMKDSDFSRQLMNKAKWFLCQQDTENIEARLATKGSAY
jgi:hypothetical protein